jgi:hypothetical protein
MGKSNLSQPVSEFSAKRGYMSRKILGVVVGLIVAVAIFLVAEMVATLFDPHSPKNLEYMSVQERETYFGTMPIGAYLTTAFGYLLGSLAAGWLATSISKQRNSMTLALIAGIILTIGGLINFFIVLPGQPGWFVALSLVLYIPFALIGHRLGRMPNF